MTQTEVQPDGTSSASTSEQMEDQVCKDYCEFVTRMVVGLGDLCKAKTV
jgi:hypothetical protein